MCDFGFSFLGEKKFRIISRYAIFLRMPVVAMKIVISERNDLQKGESVSFVTLLSSLFSSSYSLQLYRQHLLPEITVIASINVIKKRHFMHFVVWRLFFPIENMFVGSIITSDHKKIAQIARGEKKVVAFRFVEIASIWHMNGTC